MLLSWLKMGLKRTFFKHRGITMSEEIETLISEIMDADEIEILEFDFEPIFSKLRKLEEMRLDTLALVRSLYR